MKEASSTALFWVLAMTGLSSCTSFLLNQNEVAQEGQEVLGAEISSLAQGSVFEAAFPILRGSCTPGASVIAAVDGDASILASSCDERGVLEIQLELWGEGGERTLSYHVTKGGKSSDTKSLTGRLGGKVIPVGSSRSFTSIRQAVQSVSVEDGDYLALDEEVFIEGSVGDPTLVIDKSLSIGGRSAASTIVKPGADTPSVGGSDAKTWIRTQSLSTTSNFKTVHFSNITFNGDKTNRQIVVALRLHSYGSIRNCIFEDIRYSKYSGSGVSIYNNMVVEDSIFRNIERNNLFVNSAPRLAHGATEVIELRFERNHLIGSGPSEDPNDSSKDNRLNYGMIIESAKAVIKNNTFEGFLAVSDSAPVRYPSANLILSQNDIIEADIVGNYFGTSSSFLQISSSDFSFPVSVKFRYNYMASDVFEDDESYIEPSSLSFIDGFPALIDARFNWWGHADGPKTAFNDGQGGAIVRNDPAMLTFNLATDSEVDSSDWLVSGVDLYPDLPGFQCSECP